MKLQPRVRIFAGPNGSGKSLLKSAIPKELIGIYVNADEIEKEIKEVGFLDLKKFQIDVKRNELIEFFQNSELLKKAKIKIKEVSIIDEKLELKSLKINSYIASVIADFIRNKLLLTGKSFSFETVMSFQDKISFIKEANKFGYKTYLYFIATESPQINISRVKHRVSQGGHDVSEEKIISRYYRSLDLLSDGIKNSWRCYIFDNSGNQYSLIANSQEGKIIEITTNLMPFWFKKYVIDKIKL